MSWCSVALLCGVMLLGAALLRVAGFGLPLKRGVGGRAGLPGVPVPLQRAELSAAERALIQAECRKLWLLRLRQRSSSLPGIHIHRPYP